MGSTLINNNYTSLFFYKVDSVGNITKIKSFTQIGWYHYYNSASLIELKNGGYLYLGEKDSSNTNPIHYIIRFDANMDTLWTKIIHNTNTQWEALRQVKETSDNALIFVGSIEISTNNLGILLLKTDSLGNQLWEKTLNVNNGASRIIETPDKCFILKGYRDSNVLGDGDPFIIKTDSAGNQLWIKYLGSNQYDGSAAVAVTNDNNYIVAYGYSTYTSFNNASFLARLNLIKYAADGSIIWNRYYDTIRKDLNVIKIQILANNDFIVMGENALPTQGVNYSFFPSFLFKFNANGDSLWRKIYYLTNQYVDENTLADNVLNTDGSITACGWVSSDSQVPYQQIWLLKTDSNGYAPGPQNVGVIDLPYLQLSYGVLKLYPNPATTTIMLSITTALKQGEVSIYNMLGIKVMETQLSKAQNTFQLDISQLSKGYYKVILSDYGYIKGEASLLKE